MKRNSKTRTTSILFVIAIFSFFLTECGKKRKMGGPTGPEDLAGLDQSKIFPDLNRPPKNHKMPKGLKGDARAGKKIFGKNKGKGAGDCVACHCVSGVKGCGNIGSVLNGFAKTLKGSRNDDWLFAQIADARIQNSQTVMPPNLKPTGVLSKQEIVDVMTYLKTIK